MTSNKKFTIALFLVAVLTMFGFARYYFSVFYTEIQNYSKRDRQILDEINIEVIEKLQGAQSAKQWQRIIDAYAEDIVIHIESPHGELIIKTTDKEWSPLDVKVEDSFSYEGNDYVIRSSVYLLRDFLTGSDYVFRIMFITLLLLLFLVALIIVILYLCLLKPVALVSDNIERYEKGLSVKRTKRRTEIAKLQNRFVDMTETISKQQESQRAIIASISHDIKTPLTSIMGYTEMLKKDNISPERRERYLNTVYQRSVDIKALIDEFDEYLSYNMDSSLRTETVKVSDMISQITTPYYDELLPLNVKLINKVSSGDSIQIDIQKMRRVFGNLVGNSLKHFNKEEKLIVFSSYSTDNLVTIVVSDNGEGVEEDKYKMIFEPLYTSDQGRKVAGLGLAICKEIIESHGGTINGTKSEYGGLAVEITLKKVNRKG